MLPRPLLLRTGLVALATAGSLAALSDPLPPPPAEGASTAPWDARAAEHLINRAGFGAGRAEIEAAVAAGREAYVEQLLAGFDPTPPIYPEQQERIRNGLELPLAGDATPDDRRELLESKRPRGYSRFHGYSTWWAEQMLAGNHPLRDRMTLFWQGFVVSSIFVLRDTDPIVRQHQYLLEHALGPFDELIRGIARDPAMLFYLDNRINSEKHPNENWARELMELFTLGVDHYTEDDIKEAARAFSGWTDHKKVYLWTDENDFHFERREHDFGQKTVLGTTGRLNGDDVIDVILGGEDCGRWLAFRLIEYFEGTEPAEARVESYSAFLRDHGYDVGEFLRKLFNDPAFYRDEVVGTRVAGPIDYLVGTARRLGIHPPGMLLTAGGDILGQRLFAPPSVKGWEEGMAWINTATMLHRANLAGFMLGLVDVSSFLDVETVMEANADGAPAAGQRLVEPRRQVAPGEAQLPPGYITLLDVQLSGWTPDIDWKALIAGKRGDREIVAALADELLATPLPASSLDYLASVLAAERSGGMNAEDSPAEGAAPRHLALVAHLMLSLPEAQFN